MYGAIKNGGVQKEGDDCHQEQRQQPLVVTMKTNESRDTNLDSRSATGTPSFYRIAGKIWTQLVVAGFLMAVVAVVFADVIGSSPSSSVPDEASSTRLNTPLLSLAHNTTSTVVPPAISKRGAKIQPVRDDLAYFVQAAMDPYDPLDNPDGYLVMLVAENKLMWKEMAQKLEQVQAENNIPEWALDYGDVGGELHFKKAMGNMMQRWIKDAPIDATKYLSLQAGAGSVLSQMSYALADTNDGLLITAPGYMPLTSDLGIYGHTETHLVQTQVQHRYIPQTVDLEDAYQRSVAAGNPPRILVLIQPNNPTGTIYPKHDMHRMIEWALDKGLHVISDEIYALSAFPGVEVTSAATAMYERSKVQGLDDERYLGDYVHVVAGLSKDWGLSGFRVGSLFTHNVQLLAALGNGLGYYQMVSQYTQNAMTHVFQDDEWVDWYIQENKRRIHESYQALEQVLDLIDVPLYPADGAIFAWADFSAYLKNGTEGLWLELFETAKVLFTSGESCAGDKPGMMRIVYTWPEGGTLAVEEMGRRLVAWKEGRS